MEFPSEPMPSNPGMTGARIDPPVRTWFFERDNGAILPVQEAEAWRIYSGKNQTIGQILPRLKLIGVSDGKLYFNALIEAKEIYKTGGLEKAQERIRQGLKEEIEAARGNIIPPRNFDTIGQNGDAVRIQDLK